MGLIASLSDLKKTLPKHENVTKIINMKHKKNQEMGPMGLCTPWANCFIHNWKNIKNKQQKNMTFCWKYWDHSKNNCEELTQWNSVLLGATLTYTTPKLNNLRKLPESNQCIDGNRRNNKKRHPRYGLPQTWGGRKSICPVWIRPTENLQAHPRKSFRINERWSNKYDTYKSTINKRRLGRRTWRIF